MKTAYSIIPPEGEIAIWITDMAEQPGYRELAALIEPLLGDGEPLEHVNVLHEGKYHDMFVSEFGHMRLTTRGPLPHNPRATAIYRANWLSQHPEIDPETMPTIAGTAVLFHRRVWF